MMNDEEKVTIRRLKAHKFHGWWRVHIVPALSKRLVHTIGLEKSGKPGYTTPNAYGPIALLHTRVKSFAWVMVRRMTYLRRWQGLWNPSHVHGCDLPGYDFLRVNFVARPGDPSMAPRTRHGCECSTRSAAPYHVPESVIMHYRLFG